VKRSKVNVICPRVRIPEGVWKKLLAYIDACPMEIGGFGTIEKRDGELVVTDVFLIEQEVSAASVEFDAGGFARFLGDWVKQGRDLSLLRFWWHSHATFDCFWSDIDLRTIGLLSREDYLVSFVGNHRRESRMRLTVGKPIPVTLDDIELEVIAEVDPAIAAAAEADVVRLVRKKKRKLFGSWSEPTPVPLPPEDPIEADIAYGDLDGSGKR
jgi:hypothetical protein